MTVIYKLDPGKAIYVEEDSGIVYPNADLSSCRNVYDLSAGEVSYIESTRYEQYFLYHNRDVRHLAAGS